MTAAIAPGEQVGVGDAGFEVGALVDTVKEFGLASIGLVAWEYCVPEGHIADAWAAAVSQGLIRSVGPCPNTGEMMFAVADR